MVLPISKSAASKVAALCRDKKEAYFDVADKFFA